jgi:hypothetical protein
MLDRVLRVRLTQSDITRLRRYSEVHDRPIATSVRRAVRMLLEAELEPDPMQAEPLEPEL